MKMKSNKNSVRNFFNLKMFTVQMFVVQIFIVQMFALQMFIAQPAFAQELRVEATVESEEVELGQPFELTVAITSGEAYSAEKPALSGLNDFELLGSSKIENYSNQLKPGAGGMVFESTHRTEYTFTLNPKKLGRITIPAIEVQVDDKVQRTKPILLNVVEPGSNSRVAPRPRAGQGNQVPDNPFEDEDDIFSQLLQQRQGLLNKMQQQMNQFQNQANPQSAQEETYFDPQFRTLPKNPNEAFFVQVETDKTEAFEGEQVTVAWSIYTRGRLESLDRVKFPDLRGFWKEIIEEVPALNFAPEIINGVEYQRALLAAHALFPIKAGTSSIDEFKIKSKVRLSSMGGFGFGKPFEYTKSSQRVAIKVKPLPIENKPADFTGAVGLFEVNSTVEKNVVSANEPFVLRVRFEGKGNAKMIELPNLNLPGTLENYDTKSDSKFFKNGTSYKEFTMLVIPRALGEITVPEIKFSFFDPVKAEYYTKTVEPILIRVEGKLAENPNQSTKKGSVDKLDTEGVPLVMSALIYPSFFTQIESKEFFVVLFSVLVLLFLARFIFVFLLSGKRAGLKELLNRRYQRIDQALKQQDVRKVGSEVLNVMF
ncbi:MAG: BatD family protein, partial [Pseudobdellovibrionaceae bacterium]